VLWRQQVPTRPLSLAVNLSPRQFLDSELAADIAGVLQEVGLDPTLLELEVTEATAIEDVLESIATMRRLRALGVRLVVDDFGAGYAGLGYLRRYPVDAIKIDRSFVAGLDRDGMDTAMVRAILAFAETIGLDVTAEGIETVAQCARLREMGCHRGQGFWFAPAVPADKLTALLMTGIETAR
jgi:EAL domain-containing protein (putative c-di-GMP-specific phosphodiesterase class I)